MTFMVGMNPSEAVGKWPFNCPTNSIRTFLEQYCNE